ncbi:nuclear pore protein 84/107 [Chytridium lagenaria]|nr:nuclear pore protein 84/107 [Chytridium lagenaria]
MTEHFMADGDEDVENGGNVNRSLWKATCYATAREESFDSYERALFAALAGDVENALSVCTQWEDVLWINYLSLLEQTLGQRNFITTICKLTEEVSMELPPPAKSPFEIFEALRRSDKKDIRMASFDPFRIFQTMWILNRLDEFFIDFNYQIEDRALSLNYLPHYLRFITHVILFLRSIAYPLSPQAVDSTDQIIRKYVGLLVAAAKYHLVAIFTSQLPNSQQIETHAFMLTNINDEKTTRYKYVRQASDYGLDTNRVLARTVELVFADGVLKESLPGAVASVFLTSFLNPISPSDAIQIRALEWLCYDDSQKEDLLLKTNILLRRFLGETLETLPEENLRSEWLDLGIARMSRSEGEEEEEAMDLGEMQIFSAEAVEFINYKGLLQCAKFYASWRALMGSRPLIPAGKTRATYQYRDWVDQVKKSPKMS